jgi:hypothetical protein
MCADYIVGVILRQSGLANSVQGFLAIAGPYVASGSSRIVSVWAASPPGMPAAVVSWLAALREPRMRTTFGTIFLLAIPVIGAQQAPRWTGGWTLVLTSTDRAALVAFGPVPVSQQLRLRRTETSLEIDGETTLEGGAAARRETQSLRLDGTPTVVGPISIGVARSDLSSIEIVTEATVGQTSIRQVSQFAVSADGGTLTETKTRTERSLASPADDPALGVSLRTYSVSLVFQRSSTPQP